MQKKFFKKLAAMMLALCLLMSSIPTVALSEEAEAVATPAPAAEPTAVSSDPTAEPTAAAQAEAGETTPEAGKTTPEAGETTPEAGETTPEAGETTPEAGETTPESGETTSEATSEPTASPASEATEEATPTAEPTVVSSATPEATSTMPAAQDQPLASEGEANYDDEVMPLSAVDLSEYKYVVSGLSEKNGTVQTDTYTITISKSSANSEKSDYLYKEGDFVTLTVTPAENYELTSLKLCYSTTGEVYKSFTAQSENNQYSFTMPADSLYYQIAVRDARIIERLKMTLNYYCEGPSGNLWIEAESQAIIKDANARICTEPLTNGCSLNVGTYELTDFSNINAPYKLPSGTISFTVNADGTLSSNHSALKITQEEGVWKFELTLLQANDKETLNLSVTSGLTKKIGDLVYREELTVRATNGAGETVGGNFFLYVKDADAESYGSSLDSFTYLGASDTRKFKIEFYPTTDTTSYATTTVENLSIADLKIAQDTSAISGLKAEVAQNDRAFQLELKWDKYWSVSKISNTYSVAIQGPNDAEAVKTPVAFNENEFTLSDLAAYVQTHGEGDYTVSVTALYDGSEITCSTVSTTVHIEFVEVSFVDVSFKALVGENISSRIQSSGYDTTKMGDWMLIRNGETRMLTDSDVFQSGDVVRPKWRNYVGTLYILHSCTASELPLSGYDSVSFQNDATLSVTYNINGVDTAVTLKRGNVNLAEVLSSLGYDLSDGQRSWKVNDKETRSEDLYNQFLLTGSSNTIVSSRKLSFSVGSGGQGAYWDGTMLLSMENGGRAFFYSGETVSLKLLPSSGMTVSALTLGEKSLLSSLTKDGNAYVCSFTMPQEDVLLSVEFGEPVSTGFLFKAQDPQGNEVSLEGWKFTLDGVEVQSGDSLSLAMGHVYTLRASLPEDLAALYTANSEFRFALSADGEIVSLSTAGEDGALAWRAEYGWTTFTYDLKDRSFVLDVDAPRYCNTFLYTVDGEEETYTDLRSFKAGTKLTLKLGLSKSSNEVLYSLTINGTETYAKKTGENTYSVTFEMPAKDTGIKVTLCPWLDDYNFNLVYADGADVPVDNGYQIFKDETIRIVCTDANASEFGYRWVWADGTSTDGDTAIVKSAADIYVYTKNGTAASPWAEGERVLHFDLQTTVSCTVGSNGTSQPYTGIPVGTKFLDWWEEMLEGNREWELVTSCKWKLVRSGKTLSVDANTVIHDGDRFVLLWMIASQTATKQLYICADCTVADLPAASAYAGYVWAGGSGSSMQVKHSINGTLYTFEIGGSVSNDSIRDHFSTIAALDSVLDGTWYMDGAEVNIENKQLPLNYSVFTTDSGAEGATYYSVTIPAIEHGSIIDFELNGTCMTEVQALSKLTAGSTLSFSIGFDSGYSINGSTYTLVPVDADKGYATVSPVNGIFTMPAYDVYLNLEEVKYSYSITLSEGEGYTVTCDKISASVGDAVTVKISYDPNEYSLGDVQAAYTYNSYPTTKKLTLISDADGVATYRLEMPAANVNIQVSATPIERETVNLYLVLEDPATDGIISGVTAKLVCDTESIPLAVNGSNDALKLRKDCKYTLKLTVPEDCAYQAPGETITLFVEDGRLKMYSLDWASLNLTSAEDAQVPSHTLTIGVYQSKYRLTSVVNGGGYLYTTPATKYVEQGTLVSLKMVPKQGHMLTQIAVQGQPLTTVGDAEYCFSMPSNDVSVTAEFKECVSFSVKKNGSTQSYKILKENASLSLWLAASGDTLDADANYIFRLTRDEETSFVDTSEGIQEGDCFEWFGYEKGDHFHFMVDATYPALPNAALSAKSYSFDEGAAIYNISFYVEGEKIVTWLHSGCITIRQVFELKNVDTTKTWRFKDNNSEISEEVNLNAPFLLSYVGGNFYCHEYLLSGSVYDVFESEYNNGKASLEFTVGGETRYSADAGETVKLSWSFTDDTYCMGESGLRITSPDGTSFTDYQYADTGSHSFTMPESDVEALLYIAKAVSFKIHTADGKTISYRAPEDSLVWEWFKRNGYTYSLDVVEGNTAIEWACLRGENWIGVEDGLNNDFILEGDEYYVVWRVEKDADGEYVLVFYRDADATVMSYPVCSLPYTILEGAKVKVEHCINDEDTTFILTSGKDRLSDFVSFENLAWYSGDVQIDPENEPQMPLNWDCYYSYRLYEIEIPDEDFPDGCSCKLIGDQTRFKEDDEVKFSVTCATGYEVESVQVYVKQENGEGDSFQPSLDESGNYGFTMRDGETKIVVKFKKTVYKIHIINLSNGYAEVDAANCTSTYGETVAIRLHADAGYGLDALNVMDAKKNPISLNQSKADSNVYTFSMPASDVYIESTYIPAMTAATSYTITIPAEVNLNRTDKMVIKASDFVDMPANASVSLTVHSQNGVGAGTAAGNAGILRCGDESIPYILSHSTHDFTEEGQFELKMEIQTADVDLNALSDGAYTDTLRFWAKLEY